MLSGAGALIGVALTIVFGADPAIQGWAYVSDGLRYANAGAKTEIGALRNEQRLQSERTTVVENRLSVLQPQNENRDTEITRLRQNVGVT